MAVGANVSLISTSPAVYAVVAIENDGVERIVARYPSFHRAELRVKRLRAMMSAEREDPTRDKRPI
jgi:hypothetical protein